MRPTRGSTRSLRPERLAAVCIFGALFAACDTVTPTPTPDDEPPGEGSPDPLPPGGGPWAFVATFDGDPAGPSQQPIPPEFDFSVTHRTHPRNHDPLFDPFPADHGMDCGGPTPSLDPVPQHPVVTSHRTSGRRPDASFFVCRGHLMSSMGDVEGYSVSAFWPRQEFDFADGGVLEFDVNLTAAARSWWEIVIVPRDQLRVGAARVWLPIDETYPEDRILLDFNGGKRRLEVGTADVDPLGWIAGESDWASWADLHPDDPANSDRRIRRRMRLEVTETSLTWSIDRGDGSMDSLAVALPDGLPFTRGLVVFKTHAYTPRKDGNLDTYTFHWDNLRFTGPVVGRYESFETEELVYLQSNGNRAIGERRSVSIDLPALGAGAGPPVLFGQVHNAMRGQVRLKINGGEERVVDPFEETGHNCNAPGWTSFRVPLTVGDLKVGPNTFEWIIGPRPSCVADWVWDGFSIKGLEVQSLLH